MSYANPQLESELERSLEPDEGEAVQLESEMVRGGREEVEEGEPVRPLFSLDIHRTVTCLTSET